MELLLSHTQLPLQDTDHSIGAGRFPRTSFLGLSDGLALEIARKAGHLPLGALTSSSKGSMHLVSQKIRPKPARSLNWSPRGMSDAASSSQQIRPFSGSDKVFPDPGMDPGCHRPPGPSLDHLRDEPWVVAGRWACWV